MSELLLGKVVLHKRSRIRYRILQVHRSGSMIYGYTVRQLKKVFVGGAFHLKLYGPSRYLAVENTDEPNRD